MKQNLINLKKVARCLLIGIMLIVCVFSLTACGEASTKKSVVYNTKDMTDEQITKYFSEKVLQDVKNDVRNRSIIIYELDEKEQELAMKWALINEEGKTIIDSDAQTGIYVDTNAPETEIPIIKIMIGWDESDLNQEWTVEIYYETTEGTETVKNIVDKVVIDVSSENFVK